MVAPHIEPNHLYGIYEPGGQQLMLDAGHPGWLIFSEEVGHDPEDHSGVDFSPYSNQGLGIICRINHGYEPDGTIPHSSQYEQFARRVANFVDTSLGCHIWVIGNEMNYAAERSGIVIDWSRHHIQRDGPPEEADPRRRGVAVRFNALPDSSTEIRTTRGAIVSPGEVITPELYARCFRLCREMIHRLPGHEADKVLVGAVAPWNTQTIYATNPNGDWIQYFQDLLQLLGPEGCDGFTLHAFTRGAEPALITSDRLLTPPFQTHHANFRAYRDFMAVVPRSMRHLPVYITETDQILPWADVNQGWVQGAYAEIDRWNQEPGNQQIHVLALYRWPRLDKWYIEGKNGVIEDFRQAVAHGYQRQGASQQEETQPDATPAPVDEQAYAVAWIADTFPEPLIAGRTITAQLTVCNRGALTWTWGGGNPFRLGYHYYRNRRRLDLGVEKDIRTDIPYDIPHDETVSLDVQIALPDEPGNYTLELDFVQEGVTWFKEKGSEVLTRWLIVEGETSSIADNGKDDVGSNLPVPLFKDVSRLLPRSAGAYARRSLDQIRYLVISHTAVEPRVSLHRIAAAHVRGGYPGIVYDFMVDQSGHIFKTSDLEDVAAPQQPWSIQGVNVGLAGNFGRTLPSPAQLDATGRLCAWLARNLGLDSDAIVGLGALVRSESPGRTFYHGPSWQNNLKHQVQLHLAVLDSGAESSRNHDHEDELAALQQEKADLQADHDALRTEIANLYGFNERLQNETNELRRQANTRVDLADGRPQIQDMTAQLPRIAGRYRLRSPADVRHIVINHTAVAPGVPLRKIAEAHMPDWPGILFDFVIDEVGTIRQTQPLEEVVDTSEEYLADAINIAFVGRFDDTAPNSEQLYAGGQLIAWLLLRYPQLGVEDLRGLSEFIETESPGRQWLSGVRWKQQLTAAVRRSSGLVDPTDVENELREQLKESRRKVQLLQHNTEMLSDQRRRLEAENQQLNAALVEQGRAQAAYVVPKPMIRQVSAQLPRHPTLKYRSRTLDQISHIAIHHTATLPSIGPGRIAELHVSADPGRGKEAWPGIGYHYFVHADGAVAQTNRLDTVSFHLFQHDTYSVGIAFAGSFMNGAVPTSAQIRSGAHLIAWLSQELEIPLARVWGHRDFPDNITVCPGSEWTGGARWRDTLFQAIEEIQRGRGVKSIRHYLLFWHRAYPGPLARQDYINAIGYVSRFRPTLGFSVDDARNAEYVTIIGNEAGVSADSELSMRQSGCKVERIAGRTEEETGRMLAELTRLGRRFRTFEVDF